MARATKQELSALLYYQFHNPDLLVEALTHRSVSRANNERLEFLGDAVLGMVMAEWLFRRTPDAEEGDLSRLRATLVNRRTLAGIAQNLKLGNYLALGEGERKSGGSRRESILADALEAVLGAVYLDGGVEAARSVIEHLFASLVEELPAAESLKDPKTQLQEYLQARGLPTPFYEVTETHGLAHQQEFVVTCQAEGLHLTSKASGSSRRKAEQTAAEKVLQQIFKTNSEK